MLVKKFLLGILIKILIKSCWLIYPEIHFSILLLFIVILIEFYHTIDNLCTFTSYVSIEILVGMSIHQNVCHSHENSKRHVTVSLYCFHPRYAVNQGVYLPSKHSIFDIYWNFLYDFGAKHVFVAKYLPECRIMAS